MSELLKPENEKYEQVAKIRRPIKEFLKDGAVQKMGIVPPFLWPLMIFHWGKYAEK